MGHVRRSLNGVLALLFMATSALLIGHPASMPAAVGIRSVAGGGDKLWLDRYDGGGLEDAFDVAASPDGSTVFVTGESDYEYVTFAYDSITGSTLWARRYSGPGSTYNLALDIEVTPDGSKVFVTGYSSTPTTGDDYATVAYDARTGTPLWASRFDGPDHAQDLPEGLAVSPDGSKVFVTGWSEGGHSN